jgi:LDH2 family malate/lactate/ureidoglycolate dehydrogenase
VSENQLRRWQNCLFVPHSLIYYLVAGYGWATTVELLSTAFQSGPFGEDLCGVDRATGAKKPMPLGHFFLAINIEALCPLETFKENSGKLLRALRSSRKSPLGPGRIFTAGEPEHDERVKQYAQGGMNVPEVLQQNMKDLRDKFPSLKEKYPSLPFE